MGIDCNRLADILIDQKLHTAGSSGLAGKIVLLVGRSLRPGGSWPLLAAAVGVCCSSSSAESGGRGPPERQGRLPMS